MQNPKNPSSPATTQTNASPTNAATWRSDPQRNDKLKAYLESPAGMAAFPDNNPNAQEQNPNQSVNPNTSTAPNTSAQTGPNPLGPIPAGTPTVAV